MSKNSRLVATIWSHILQGLIDKTMKIWKTVLNFKSNYCLNTSAVHKLIFLKQEMRINHKPLHFVAYPS